MKAKIKPVEPAGQGKKKAFTLVEILIVLGIIALLISIAVPYFVTYRTNAQAKACVENLRVIESAKQLWAIEEKKAANSTCDLTDLVGAGRYIKTTPYCPGSDGDDYVVGRVDEQATCPRSLPLHAL